MYLVLLLQTPAERVRAKLKLMLDKTTDKMSKESSSEEQSSMMVAPPSAADIARIEGEAFEPASFVSHRTAKKVERERARGGGEGGRESEREGGRRKERGGKRGEKYTYFFAFTLAGSPFWNGRSQETL
jgi:hypothetical protein